MDVPKLVHMLWFCGTLPLNCTAQGGVSLKTIFFQADKLIRRQRATIHGEHNDFHVKQRIEDRLEHFCIY